MATNLSQPVPLVTYRPVVSGRVRQRTWEEALVEAGEAKDVTCAKALIARTAETMSRLAEIAAQSNNGHRLAAFTRRLDAVLDGFKDASLTSELRIAEQDADGEQDTAFERFIAQPTVSNCRRAAHSCFAHARLLMQKGTAILRVCNLA